MDIVPESSNPKEKQAGALDAIGFTPAWRERFEPYTAQGWEPARVLRSDRGSALVACEAGVVRAQAAASLLKAARGPIDLPVVGDWAALFKPADLDVPRIEAVLPRTSAMVRGDPAKGSQVQVLAANMDIVFLVQPIANGPNLRRIERELALAWDSGALPVVLLTKADLCADAEEARAKVEAIAPGVEVLAFDALDPAQVVAILPHLQERRTAIVIGPSGAGKSTIINTLLGEERQATREVRMSDGRGRHTTVVRELIALPSGALLIDTPGLRSIVQTGSEEGIAGAFPDIEELAAGCRFRDCTHQDEPGCAVHAAVDSGLLAAERLASYHKLVREAKAAARKTDARLRAEEARKWKIIHKSAKELYKRRGH